MWNDAGEPNWATKFILGTEHAARMANIRPTLLSLSGTWLPSLGGGVDRFPRGR
jgi:hypothetical protein